MMAPPAPMMPAPINPEPHIEMHLHASDPGIPGPEAPVLIPEVPVLDPEPPENPDPKIQPPVHNPEPPEHPDPSFHIPEPFEEGDGEPYQKMQPEEQLQNVLQVRKSRIAEVLAERRMRSEADSQVSGTSEKQSVQVSVHTSSAVKNCKVEVHIHQHMYGVPEQAIGA